jgi:23S rRNA pseudouridine1911/1915/1917 synthase
MSWNRARDLVRSGRVYMDGARCQNAELRVPAGVAVEIHEDAPRLKKGTLSPEAIVHVDADVVVVRKHAGILSVPYEDSDKDTLVDITRAALRQRGPKGYAPELGVVHRIDVDTTGLLVFTRTLAAKRHLSQQFRDHTVHRRYLAIAHGDVRAETFDTLLVQNRGDGLRGSYGHFRAPMGDAPEEARQAITHVRPRERLRGATLVECKLETGRQHQIRIHLAEAGHPLVGERVYIRDYEAERIGSPRPMLHAAELGFVHPRTEEEVRFTDEPPEDFQAMLESLRP